MGEVDVARKQAVQTQQRGKAMFVFRMVEGDVARWKGARSRRKDLRIDANFMVEEDVANIKAAQSPLLAPTNFVKHMAELYGVRLKDVLLLLGVATHCVLLMEVDSAAQSPRATKQPNPVPSTALSMAVGYVVKHKAATSLHRVHWVCVEPMEAGDGVRKKIVQDQPAVGQNFVPSMEVPHCAKRTDVQIWLWAILPFVSSMGAGDVVK